MRTLLMASAATVAGAFAWPAFAQTAAPDVNLPPTVTQGIVSKPVTTQAANSSNNVSAAPGKNGITAPVPGSIVVRVNARVVFYAAAESSSLDKTAGTGPTNSGAAKLDPAMTLGFMRLYFAMDGLATNGLRYGGSVEIRQNNGGVGGSTANTGSSASTTSETLYVRRAFGYVAGDQWGIVRFGQGDSPLGIFDNGVTTFQNFDDTAWNGPNVNQAIPTNAQPTFPFLSLTGSDYGSSKLGYFSPQVAGFDVGLSYAPNNLGLQDGNCAFASSGCYNLSSSATAADATRYTNWYVAALRYQNLFGPVGVYAMGAYYGSGHVNYTGSTPGNQFDALSVGDFGLALQYAGFVVGGHVTTGVTNGQGALQPKNGVHAVAWLGGVQWAGGPLTIGASFFNYRSQGAAALVGITQRNENGLDVGLTYAIAPGIAIWAQYLYGTRYQGDYNFQTGAVGGAFNNVKSQAFGVGPVIRW